MSDECPDYGQRISLRLPRDLIDELPEGVTLSDRVRGAVRIMVAQNKAAAALPEKIDDIAGRLDALTKQGHNSNASVNASNSLPLETAIAMLDAMRALSEDLARLQKMVLPILRYIEKSQKPGDKITRDEVEQLARRVDERNHRMITEPRERLASRLQAEED